MLQTPESFSWRLRNFRKRQNGENSPCGTSASIKMEEMALAGLPQASKWRKWRLRNFRKRQNGKNGPCGTSANAKKFLERLAGLPQTPKSFSRDLRDSRKRQKVIRGPCGVPANAKKFSGALAGLPQTLTLFLRAWEEWYNENGRVPEGLRPTGTRPNLLADPTYSVGMSRLTFFEPTRA